MTHEQVIYQDKHVKRDIGGDMLETDLSGFDLIIATPPCNYYSRARGKRPPSQYAEDTKHLLPGIIKKLTNQDMPFIVENVINKKSMKDIIASCGCFYYEHGRHSYFTNMLVNLNHIPQMFDFKSNGNCLRPEDRQGGKNVNAVFDFIIQFCATSCATINFQKEGTYESKKTTTRSNHT